MPGVIMENGIHSNHDRDMMLNGINGANRPNDLSRKQSTQSQSRTPQYNGGRESEGHASQTTVGQLKKATTDLPPEINHIEEGFEQLPKMLTRLAQLTHNELNQKIEELAIMPIQPSPIPGTEDNSKENIVKKVNLLKFLEKQHENWTKALVITNWSRVSEDVGKLIDLQSHITERRFHYDMAFHEMSELKRGLVHAKVPNPDFKTAVEVLSTGKASWMPDLGYIEPPRLTAKVLLRSLQNLNTLLSERLNLHDYENIPYHFRNYSIKNGRVTFTVEDEFEVDLTIADEDPEKQFWFIDFRFLFTPAVPNFKDHIRYALESEVNAAIEKDGLFGCYKVLHELTLTHKLAELRRQAHELARGRWIDTLQVEALHRGVSIQYWRNRYGENGPKSWIMLGPVSGKRKDGHNDKKVTSRIGVRWFRDGKEVPGADAKIQLNLAKLFAEEVIRSVIGLHVGHILRSIKRNLVEMPLFASRELALALRKSKTANGEPELIVQLTRQRTVKVLVEHITGKFAFTPATRLAVNVEAMINTKTMDPATNGHEFIINLHARTIVDETMSAALTVGWEIVKQRLAQDELKTFMPKDTRHISSFRRRGWLPNWFLALSSGLSGESWFLVLVTDPPKENATGIAGLDGPKVRKSILVPTKSKTFDSCYEFLSMLTTLTSSIISLYTNKLALYERRAKVVMLRLPKTKKKQSCIAEGKQPESAQQESSKEESTEKTDEEETMEEVKQTLSMIHKSAMKIPNIFVKISTLLPLSSIGRPWAEDDLDIKFDSLVRDSEPSKSSKPTTTGNGLLSPPQTQPSQSTPSSQFNSHFQSSKTQGSETSVDAVLVATGHVLSTLPSGLLDKQAVDAGIAFNTSTNSFQFRLQSKVGEPVIEMLVQQLERVSRLVDFVQTMDKHKENIECESISLNCLQFTYSYKPSGQDGKPAQPFKETAEILFPGENRDESAESIIEFKKGNPHIRIKNFLEQILNDPKYGIEGLVISLPMTLPVLRAVDAAEEAWAELGPKTNTEYQCIPHSSDNYRLRYDFYPPSKETMQNMDVEAQAANAERRRRTMQFKLTQRMHLGDTWWHIRRDGYDGKKVESRNDEFDKLLKAEVWSKTVSNVWKGQMRSAIAKPCGAEALIGAVDAVMQTIAKDPTRYFVELEPAPKKVEQLTAPLAPMMQASQKSESKAKPAQQPQQKLNQQQPQSDQRAQPQRPNTLVDRASTMQLKLPQKRPQPQTANTAHPPSTGPPQAPPVQKNPTVPMTNMRSGALAAVGGVPMSVSASMPGKPPSMMAQVGPNAIQQAMMAAGRGKSMSPVMNKKVAQGGTPQGIPIVPGAGLPMNMGKGPNGIDFKSMTPQQVQAFQIAQRQRMAQMAQAQQQAGLRAGGGQMGQGQMGQGQMVLGGMQQRQAQPQGGQGGQQQGKVGGADAPMVID